MWHPLLTMHALPGGARRNKRIGTVRRDCREGRIGTAGHGAQVTDAERVPREAATVC